jgi:hypothetical protein
LLAALLQTDIDNVRRTFLPVWRVNDNNNKEPVPILDFTVCLSVPLTKAIVTGPKRGNFMTTQLDAAFEVIAVDGSQAYYLNTTDDGADLFEEFETHSGVTLADLDHADRTGTTVFIPADGLHYTVGRLHS